MTIDQLRQFIAVAKHLNFSRGADELFLHQSTVSKNIASMEAELGGPLFVRKKNDLRLTDAGKLLYNEAPMLVEKFDILVRRTRHIMAGSYGNLRFLSLENYTHTLAAVYKAFLTQHPNIDLDITEDGRLELEEGIESVLDGSVDLALLPLGALPSDNGDLEKRLFFRDDFVVLVSPTHPLAGRERVETRDLAGERVLLVNSMKTTPLDLINSRLFLSGQEELTIVFIDAGGHPQPDAHLLLKVLSGAGITVVPRQVALAAGWDGACARLTDLSVPFDLGIVWRRNSTNPSLPLFLEVLEEHLPDR